MEAGVTCQTGTIVGTAGTTIVAGKTCLVGAVVVIVLHAPALLCGCVHLSELGGIAGGTGRAVCTCLTVVQAALTNQKAVVVEFGITQAPAGRWVMCSLAAD